MARNIAARRAAKAQRRKVIVAKKRLIETAANSLGGQVRAVRAEPIQHCLLSETTFKSGMGMLLIARGPSRSSVTAGVFLLDTFALGAKDVFLRSFAGDEFNVFVDRMSMAAPMAPIEPSHARKLLRDLVAWSREAGFNPHEDYAKIEAIFGSVDPAACDIAFEFGHDGKPLLISGLSDFGGFFGDSDDDLADDDEGDFEGTVLEAEPQTMPALPDESDDRAAA